MGTQWFDPRAAEELMHAAADYKAITPELGQRFALAVKKALDSIEENPKIHSPINAGCRKCRVVRFPYKIIFREHEKGIQIIAVMHMKRRPSYWLERT